MSRCGGGIGPCITGSWRLDSTSSDSNPRSEDRSSCGTGSGGTARAVQVRNGLRLHQTNTNLAFVAAMDLPLPSVELA